MLKLLLLFFVLCVYAGTLALGSPTGEHWLSAGGIPSTNAPHPFVLVGNKTYAIESKIKLNWYGAAHSCRRNHMHLASILNEDENTLLVDYLEEQNFGIHDKFWISGNDLEEEGKYQWIGTGDPVNFTKWSVGNPNKTTGEEHCLQLWYMDDSYTWNNDRCMTKQYYICEVIMDSIIWEQQALQETDANNEDEV